MVSSISAQLLYNRPIVGFGARRPRKSHATTRKRTTHVLVPISAIGGMVHHRKRTVHHRVAHHTVHHAGGSYRLAGSGIHKRRARTTLSHRRKTAGTGIRRVRKIGIRRAPIRHLGGMRKRTVHHRIVLI